MLAFIRRIVAFLVLLAFVALCSGLVPEAYVMRLMGTPRVQFVPLLLSSLSGSVIACAVLLGWVLLTLLFGRVYCSWLCPLGILQDIVNRALRPRGMKSARYTPNHYLVRALFAAVAFGSLACGSVAVLMWLDPYSICARVFATLPLLAQGADSVAWGGVAAVAFGIALPLGMAAWRGRLYCNTICPVGAVLGLLARFAPFAPRLNASACRRCATCLRRCKVHAIDLKNGRIDSTRCVACYDCVAACPHRAITLRKPAAPKETPAEAPADPTRRAILGLGALTLASALLPIPARAEEEQGGGDSESTEKDLPILPPGAGKSRARFLDTCTACGLCIANCPTGVLRPSVTAHGWDGFLKPYLAISAPQGLSEGLFCRFDCNRCSTLCPTGALTPLSLAEKQKTRIALAQHKPSRCIPWQTGYECGHCAAACPTQALTLRQATVPIRENPDACTGCRRCMRVCPQGAISLTPAPTAEKPDRRIAVIDYAKCIGCGVCASACRRHKVIRAVATQVPSFDSSRCIGCGACTAHCPATPQAAVEVRAVAGDEA